MEEKIVLPEGVSVQIVSGTVTVSREGKSIKKTLDHPGVKIRADSSSVVLSCSLDSRKGKKMVNTYKSHLKNMIQGLSEDYVYELKICSSHFPMDVSVKGDEIIIKNFLGERKARKTRVYGNAQVRIEGDRVIIRSPDKEAAGQTAANLENATRVGRYDRRRFQDGIYMTVKEGVSI